MSERSRNPERARKGRRGWTHQSRAISEKIAERLKEAEQQASPTEAVSEEPEDGSGCQLTWIAATAEHKCSRGIYGCILEHDGDDKIPD